jgi:DNA-directed RNA polymerase subunit RPC12/RpoP
MSDCPNCGERMSHNDETTKLREYACSRCHSTRIVWKPARRRTT